MPKSIAFVGRQYEIDLIAEQVQKWGGNVVVVIDGEGGIGKTRLLQEVIQRYTSKPHLLALPIIDLREPRLKAANRIEFAIIQTIGRSHFDNYQKVSLDITRMQNAKVSYSTIERELEQLNTVFIEEYNKFSQNTRVVMSFDTLESAINTTIWEYLNNLVVSMKNTLFLIAGRDSKAFYEAITKNSDTDTTHLLSLNPFETIDAQNYVAAELAYRQIDFSDKVKEQIILLSGGKPILMNLAVERIARTNSEQWMNRKDLTNFNALPEEAKNQIHQDFEQDIVRYYANFGGDEEQLKLIMAHVNWVNDDLAAKLLRINREEAHQLIVRIHPLAHIKAYPSGLIRKDLHISLHDEFARLIREYVYDEVDKNFSLRRDLSTITAEYFRDQIKTLRNNINNIQQAIEIAKRQNDVAVEVQHTLEKEELEHEYWNAIREYLHHDLYANAEDGAKLFMELFDEATQKYRFHERDTIVETILPYLKQEAKFSTGDALYEVGRRVVQHQIDSGKSDDAKEKIERLVNVYMEDISKSIELQRLRGNVFVRLGNMPEAIKSFKRAVDLSDQQTDLRLKAMAENALGWAYRLVSYWKEACFHYRKALRISQELNDLSLQASILNNLGFAHSYINHREGINLCFRALEIWERSNNLRGIGASHSTIGNIYYHMHEPDKALEHFNKALPIFQSAQDIEFLARIYSWVGITYFRLDKLDKAEEYLQLSLEQGTKEVKAQTLNRLARVHAKRGDFDKTEHLLKQSYRVSKEICDVLYELASLRDLIRIAVKKRQYNRYREFAKLINEFDERWQAPDGHPHGGTYLYLALLVLGQQRRDTSLPKYLLQKAFERMVDSSFESTPYLEEANDFLLNEVKKEVTRDIGEHLWNIFKTQENPTFDLVLDYFNRWRKSEKV